MLLMSHGWDELGAREEWDEQRRKMDDGVGRDGRGKGEIELPRSELGSRKREFVDQRIRESGCPLPAAPSSAMLAGRNIPDLSCSRLPRQRARPSARPPPILSSSSLVLVRRSALAGNRVPVSMITITQLD